jgi:ABC-2 type transport system permease protein
MRSYIQLELRSLLVSRGLWVLLLATGPLVGFSLIEAISLHNEASRTAFVTPQMAAGLNPFDGVIIPTYGSMYLTLTLLFPFIAIRTIAEDKQSGALRLLLQMPSQSTRLLPSKVAAMLFAWLLVELPGFLALLLWRFNGGHIYAPEVLCLLLGQFLYGTIVIAISFVAAAGAETSSTAALLALGCTLGSCVLDFAATGGPSWLTTFSGFSLTASLKPFEQGLLAWNVVAGLVLAALILFALTILWWHPGRSLLRKLSGSAGVLIVCSGFLLPLHRWERSIDLTDDQRHSFSPAVRAALQQIKEPVRIEVYLAPEDPRLLDYDHSILAKLKRVLPRLEVVNREGNQAALFKMGEHPNYGLVVYHVGTRRAESRSTSPEEVLPLLWSLAAVTTPASEDQTVYPGYPLVVNSSRTAELVFYLFWPALCFAGWFLSSRR